MANEIMVIESRKGGDMVPLRPAMQRSRGTKKLPEGSCRGGAYPRHVRLWALCEDTDERKHRLREAAHEGHGPAIFHYALECSDPDQRKRWLRQAAEAGNVDAMYTCAQECEDPVEALCWLRKTACEGHVQAMYEYAMHSDDPDERRLWLMRAANQGWEAARRHWMPWNEGTAKWSGSICTNDILLHPHRDHSDLWVAGLLSGRFRESGRHILVLASKRWVLRCPASVERTQLIERCVWLELQSAAIYRSLAERFSFSSPLCEFLDELADQEQEHADLLRVCKSFACRGRFVSRSFQPVARLRSAARTADAAGRGNS